jgi:hypothetical protein
MTYYNHGTRLYSEPPITGGKAKPMANAEDFTIVIQNKTGVEVRTTKFEFRDGDKSRTEHLWPSGSTRIDNGGEKDYKRNLQGVGEESTEFTVTYQHRSGKSNWSANHVMTTDTFTCKDNGSYTVVLTD